MMVSSRLEHNIANQTALRADIRNEHFQEILSEARTLSLPPACCVPYIKIRKISESGVRRLMQSYRDTLSKDSLFPGASAAGNLPIVVPLTGTLVSYPKTYFMDDLGIQKLAQKMR